MSTPAMHGISEMQIAVLQAAILALFATSRDKRLLRRAFSQVFDDVMEASLQYSVSEEAFAEARRMQRALLAQRGAGFANSTTMMDHAMRIIDPLVARKEFHQIAFDLLRV